MLHGARRRRQHAETFTPTWQSSYGDGNRNGGSPPRTARFADAATATARLVDTRGNHEQGKAASCAHGSRSMHPARATSIETCPHFLWKTRARENGDRPAVGVVVHCSFHWQPVPQRRQGGASALPARGRIRPTVDLKRTTKKRAGQSPVRRSSEPRARHVPTAARRVRCGRCRLRREDRGPAFSGVRSGLGLPPFNQINLSG